MAGGLALILEDGVVGGLLVGVERLVLVATAVVAGVEDTTAGLGVVVARVTAVEDPGAETGPGGGVSAEPPAVRLAVGDGPVLVVDVQPVTSTPVSSNAAPARISRVRPDVAGSLPIFIGRL